MGVMTWTARDQNRSSSKGPFQPDRLHWRWNNWGRDAPTVCRCSCLYSGWKRRKRFAPGRGCKSWFSAYRKIFGGYSDLSFTAPSTNFLGKNRKTEKKKKRNYPFPNCMEAKSSMQVIILCMKNALTGSNGIMHKKMNAPEGQSLRCRSLLVIKNSIPQCCTWICWNAIVNSIPFFLFRFSFTKKLFLFRQPSKKLERRQ